MSVNSSSSSNDSHLSSFLLVMRCLTYRENLYIFSMFNVAYVSSLLPLCVLVLRHGLQQWKKKPSTFSTASTSHSDVFTYHLAAMELSGVAGCILSFCAVCFNRNDVIVGGLVLSNFRSIADVLVHMLTCVDRYLAAVRPVTYLNLRSEIGVRTRNICIRCVWLISLIGACLMFDSLLFLMLNLLTLILSVLVVSFCSVSVLRVLTRPGPGQPDGEVKRLHQSKQRAFHTIMVILGVLLLRFVWDLIWVLIYTYRYDLGCMLITCSLWINLPSALLLPLLFLHRNKKSVCGKK